MSESEKWLTVREFAQLAGVSPQAIYKQLTTDSSKLSTYTKTENRCKYIHSDAIQLLKSTTISTEVDNLACENCQPSQPKLSTNSTSKNGDLQQELDRIRAQLAQVTADLDTARVQRDKADIRAAAAEAERKRADTAEAQLIVKDQQIQQQNDRIADLTAALRAAQDQNKELTTALTAAQALNAGTMQMLMEKANPEPVKTSQREHEPESIPTPQQQQDQLKSQQVEENREDVQISGAKTKNKRGLFSRIFRKDVS